jgi:NAD(P)-dependent dehydrogenase (short-subunit alcohol dehydrogenase family)
MLTEVNRDDDFVRSMRTNFHGPMNVTRSILPRLRQKGSGTLLYVSSQSAWHADPSAAAYCSSKAALEGAVECLAKELQLFAPGVKVLLAEPGYFNTQAFSNIDHVDARVPDLSPFNAGVRQFEAGLVGTAPGDSAKCVARMIDLVRGTGVAAGKAVPLRVPLGTDGWTRIKAKCEETLQVCNEWESVARSTDRESA